MTVLNDVFAVPVEQSNLSRLAVQGSAISLGLKGVVLRWVSWAGVRILDLGTKARSYGPPCLRTNEHVP
jgi:hypothetical protein